MTYRLGNFKSVISSLVFIRIMYSKVQFQSRWNAKGDYYVYFDKEERQIIENRYINNNPINLY